MNKMEINGINFDLPERYEPIKLIGKGTYGAVISAIDNQTKEKVAIKKLGKIDDMVSVSHCVSIFLDRCQEGAQGDQDYEEPAT
jgi:serine/threonine protein kinase